MRFRFRGTRGSLPVPGPETVVYGGNTTCIEVRSDKNDLVIFDAGTGISGLGRELLAHMPVRCHVFVSHTHWDHIQGLPFFPPIFAPGNEIFIYGPPDPLSMSGVEDVLNKQLEYPHFPVRVAELLADITYETLGEGRVVDLGFAKVTTQLMHHTAMNFGFRMDCDGKSLFYTGDHEPFFNIHAPGDEDYDEYGEIVAERNLNIVDAARDVDVLIADGQYTAKEYPGRKGWGHSAHEQALAFGREAHAGRVYLTHHDPARTDAELDAIAARLENEWSDIPFEVAKEAGYIEV